MGRNVEKRGETYQVGIALAASWAIGMTTAMAGASIVETADSSAGTNALKASFVSISSNLEREK